MSICLRCLRVSEAFEILENTPEAEQLQERLFAAMCQKSPHLIDALLGGPREVDISYLRNLWRYDSDGKILRAISVALKFIGGHSEFVPDLSLDDKRWLGHCVESDIWRFATYQYCADFIKQCCPQFADEFAHLIKDDMFLTEYLRELIWIVVGMLLARFEQTVIIVL